MGPNYSRQLSTVTQSVIAEAITNITNNLNNYNNYNTRAIQKIHVDYTGGDVSRCPILLNQVADLASTAIARNATQLSNDVSTEISAKIDALVKQTLEQLNEGFPVGSNKAEVIARVAQFVNESIQVNLKNTITNSMTTTSTTDQEIDVDARYFRCRNAPITFNQASTIDAMATATADTVVTNVVVNKEVADLKAAIDQEVKQTLKGLDFGFIFIIIALIVIGVIVFLSKAAKKVPVDQAVSGFKKFISSINLWLCKHRKAILIFLGVVGTLLATAYGLIRGGVVKNPFLPEYAQ
jgi:mRNA-degrading endonuclease toxin of MazEF toxin-antitoxin module